MDAVELPGLPCRLIVRRYCRQHLAPGRAPSPHGRAAAICSGLGQGDPLGAVALGAGARRGCTVPPGTSHTQPRPERSRGVSAVQKLQPCRKDTVHHYPRCHGLATGAAPGVIYRALRELPGLLRYRTSCKAALAKTGARKKSPARPGAVGYTERLPAIGLEP